MITGILLSILLSVCYCTYIGSDLREYSIVQNIQFLVDNSTLSLSCNVEGLTYSINLKQTTQVSFLSHGVGAVTILSDGSIAGMLLEAKLQLEPLRALQRQLGEQLYNQILELEGEYAVIAIHLSSPSTGIHSEIQRNLLAVAYSSFPGQDDRWDDCFGVADDSYLAMDIGVAIDYTFYAESLRYDKGNEYALIEAMFGYVNLVYAPQIGIVFEISETFIRKFSGVETWNDECVNDIVDDLDYFSDWVAEAQSDSTAAAWVLLTDCYPPPGSVGIGYVGTVCRPAGWGVHTSISSYQGSETWLTVAHELGHNFGADHSFDNGVYTTGGIMDYGDGKVDGVYQFNTPYTRDEICTTLTNARLYFPTCFNSYSFSGDPFRYFWEIIEEYSSCSASCGNSGTQTRRVLCVDNELGVYVADDYCSGSTQPLEERECNRIECEITDCECSEYSEWVSTCNSKYDDTGNRTRSRTCSSPTGSCEQDGYFEMTVLECYEDNSATVCLSVDMGEANTLPSFPLMQDRIKESLPSWSRMPEHSFELSSMESIGSIAHFRIKVFSPLVLEASGSGAVKHNKAAPHSRILASTSDAGTPHGLGAKALMSIGSDCWEDPGENGLSLTTIIASALLFSIIFSAACLVNRTRKTEVFPGSINKDGTINFY